MDYSKLSDFEVNLKLAHILLGKDNYDWNSDKKEVYLAGIDGGDFLPNGYFDPCNNPADAWPIITANRIGIIPAPEHGAWRAANRVIGANSDPRYFTQHANPLRAAMIVFLIMQESDNVQANPARPDIR